MQIDTALVTHVIPLVIAYLIIMVLFLKNRRDLKRLRAEALESVQTASAGVNNLSLQMEGIRASVRQMEEAPVVVLPGQGINLNKRAQALRMYKRGETIPSIAAALRTPTHEVQLLLKVHNLLNG